jgi:hypothetical protein
MFDLLFSGLGLLALLAIAAVVPRLLAKRRRLSANQATQLWRQFATAEAQPDLHRRVLELDKVLEAALRASGGQGSFADMLRIAGPRFSNLDALWDAHRLRNRIAHETGVDVRPSDADRAARTFASALTTLAGPRPSPS